MPTGVSDLSSKEAVMSQSNVKKLLLGFVKSRVDAKAFLKDENGFLATKKVVLTKKSKRILASIARDLVAASKPKEGGHTNLNTHTDYNASDGHVNRNSHTDHTSSY
jgi:hypothetical protein